MNNFILNKLREKFNRLRIDFWCISKKKQKLAYQYIDQVCQDTCKLLGIKIEYHVCLDDESTIEKNKMCPDNPVKVYGRYFRRLNVIELLKEYDSLNCKYHTWIHEIGHYFESQTLYKILDNISILIDEIYSMNELEEAYRQQQMIRFQQGLIDEFEELSEHYADIEGFNKLVKTLPAWVLWVLSISIPIYWKENIHMDININTNPGNYFKYFNLTANDVVASYKKFKKELKNG